MELKLTKCRETVIAYLASGYTFKDIAFKLGISQKAVYSRVSDAAVVNKCTTYKLMYLYGKTSVLNEVE